MRPDLVDILACPRDRAPLTLTATETEGDEVVTGALTCTRCAHAYPIEDGIPNLLPPEVAEG
jgi:uncharacterized protein